MNVAARSAALHGALWSLDRGYRLWWYVWPASIALLICGWIYVEKPVSTTPSSARREATASSASAPTASGSSVAAKPLEKQSVWPEKLLADARVCRNDALSAGAIIEACTRMIESGLLDERKLVTAYSQRGLHSATTQPDRALADYDAALKIQPDNPSILTDRGWINLEHNRAFAGLADLNKAIGLMEYSASARARLYRASAFLMLKDLDKAVSDLDESQRIDPTSRLLYLTRGDVEFAQKHYDAALRDYDEFSRRAPDLGDGLVGRGLILEEIGHRAEALRAIESGLKLDPTNSEAVAARERLRSAGGR